MKNQSELVFKYDDLKLEGEPVNASLPLELCQGALRERVGSLGYWVSEPFSISGNLYRTPSGEVIVSARVSGVAEFQCVSCGQRRAWSMEIREDLIVVPESHDAAQEEDIGGEGDLDLSPDVYTFSGQEFDLAEILREVLVLNAMDHPRCADVREQCGEPLAKSGSDVLPEQPEIDPRWAPLLAMRDALDSQSDREGHESDDDS